MFDLEKAIGEWRQQMARSGITATDVLNELESHLREDIARQVQAGLCPKLAFEGGVEKLGKSNALAKEFEIAEQTRELRERKIKLLCIGFMGVMYLMSFLLSIFKLWNNFNTNNQ